MYFAAFGDVSGHADLFRRAILDAQERGILTFLQTGNLVVGGDQPEECLGLAREFGVHVVRGMDEWKLARFEKKRQNFQARLDHESFAALARAAEKLSPKSLEVLEDLPRTAMIEREGVSVLLCHGSPLSERDVIEETTSFMRLQRYREARPADVIVAGGAEKAFDRWVDQCLFVNAGKLSASDDRAQYVILNTDSDPWAVERVVI